MLRSLFFISTIASVMTNPLCIGHRGIPALQPENTLASHKEALALGADGIETDVRLTSDNEVIIMHDTTLNRTTNGTGTVRDVNLAYILSLKTGGEPIPLMSQVLDLIFEYPGKKLVLDVKDDNPIEILTHMERVFSRYKLSQQVQLNTQVYIGVWNKEFLDAANRLFFGWSKCFIEDRADHAKHALTEVSIVSLNHKHLTSGQVQMMQTKRLQVSAWTVNGIEAIEKAVRLGVDIIMSDDIRVCLKIR